MITDANGDSNGYLQLLCESKPNCQISLDFIIYSNLPIWIGAALTVFYGFRKPFVGALYCGYLIVNALSHNISFFKTLEYTPGNC